MTTSYSYKPSRFDIIRNFYIKSLSAIKIQRWWRNIKSQS